MAKDEQTWEDDQNQWDSLNNVTRQNEGREATVYVL